MKHVAMKYEARRQSFNEETARYKLNKFINRTRTWRHARRIGMFLVPSCRNF